MLDRLVGLFPVVGVDTGEVNVCIVRSCWAFLEQCISATIIYSIQSFCKVKTKVACMDS
jgi:hypothetical protein